MERFLRFIGNRVGTWETRLVLWGWFVLIGASIIGIGGGLSSERSCYVDMGVPQNCIGMIEFRNME